MENPKWLPSITFDTLRFTKRLTQAGAFPELAEAIAEAFKEASGEAEVATKSDIRALEFEALPLIEWVTYHRTA
uniref:Uncharacterized protein n=1 Tax=Candidatus Kentrum sp. TC TaxID=2126339 RepID=A0A450Z1Q6_9GAMM|nr:MAG: hypothetical protein BECKTC1821E_GA0114239_10917 [Candidatus Kentron sp. TC]VFK50421.1 MAG: hypothetical protein BECKTC1821D_GA0114238_11037 [Candidatus Kentron sp. TC]